MLMVLGPVRFEVWPFNATEYEHGHEASFAEKPVLGTRPPLEWVGEGPETWGIKARIFPRRFGGLEDLKKLSQARASGRPQYMMRGDGAQIRTDIHEIRSRVGMLELDMAKIDQPAITRHFDAIEGKIDKLHDFLLEHLTQKPS